MQRRSQRGRTSAHELPWDLLYQVLRDKRTHNAEAIVVKPPGEAAHWHMADGVVLVHVELQPMRKPVVCRVQGATMGRGLAMIPPVGAMVIVAVPGGSMAADAWIIAWAESGSVSEHLDGETVVVMGPRVVVESPAVFLGGVDGAVPVALAPNVEARLTRLETQARYYAPTGGGPTSTAMLPTLEYLASYPTDPAVITNPTHAAWVADGSLKHVHAPGWPTNPCPSAATPAVNSTVPGAGTGCAATQTRAK